MSRKDRTLLILAVLALVVFPLLTNTLILVSDLSKSHPSLMSVILDISGTLLFLAVLTTVAVVGVKALMRTKTAQLLTSIRKVIANESGAKAKHEKKPEQGRKTGPSDIQAGLRGGGLCTGLNMSKERADRAMAALLERAERAANKPIRRKQGTEE